MAVILAYVQIACHCCCWLSAAAEPRASHVGDQIRFFAIPCKFDPDVWQFKKSMSLLQYSCDLHVQKYPIFMEERCTYHFSFELVLSSHSYHLIGLHTQVEAESRRFWWLLASFRRNPLTTLYM